MHHDWWQTDHSSCFVLNNATAETRVTYIFLTARLVDFYHFCRQRLHSRRIQKSIGKPKKCCLFQGKAKSLYKGKSLLSIIFYPGKIAVVQAIEFMFEHRFDRCRQLTLIAKVYPLSARIIGLSTFNVLCVIKNEQF